MMTLSAIQKGTWADTARGAYDRAIKRHVRKSIWQFLKKSETELPYNPATLFWVHTQKNWKQQSDTCTLIFITTLFTTAKRWTQPKYLLMDEWISKCGLSIQRKEILTYYDMDES